MAHRQDASTERSGCGFYGSPTTKNMCSKCHRDHLKAINTGPVVQGKIKSDEAVVLAFKKTASLLQDSASSTAESLAAEALAKKATPNRCMSCKKKVGLLGFTCRCGGTFCSLHRYVDGHACDFDYKKAARDKIAQQNPLVVAPKLNKI